MWGQCEAGQNSLLVEIVTDDFPTETTWQVTMGEQVLLEGGPYDAPNTLHQDTLCMDLGEEPCLEFELFDSFGDGLFGDAGYTLIWDGQIMAQGGGSFGNSTGEVFACAPGETCNDAFPSRLTTMEQSQRKAPPFGTFTPESNGMYSFSSCGNGCDTRLYIYDYCQMGNFDDTNEGSIYFDDNQGGCGEEAQLTVLLEAEVTYWIRWASFEGPCTESWTWTFEFVGPPTGCTDEEACNYNPMAEVDDDSCIYQEIPRAPDRISSWLRMPSSAASKPKSCR